MNNLIRPALTASALALLLFSTAAPAGMYRYTDENGQVVISNTIPQAASKRGYDILNNSGRVIETVDPAPTAKEIAEREAQKRREKREAHQRELDKKLLERFSHPDEAVRAMYRKIRELSGLSQLKRDNISVIESQLDTEQGRAADRERSGREIPEATLKKIHRLESNIREIEREISTQQAEIDAVKRQFLDDIERLEALTGKSRTLSLEVPSDDSNR
jgi:predicted RNase H-like nuclease (RuvC/YqgF family)